MKSTTSRIAAVSLVFGTLAAGRMAFSLTQMTADSRAISGTEALLGAIETDGSLDLSFNPGRFTNGSVTDSALQADGKLLIVGEFSMVHGVARQCIARLNTDGTLDTSFVPGFASTSSLYSLRLQADGQIIIDGGIVTGSGGSKKVVRLNTDGSVDSSFDPARGLSYNGLDDGNGNPTSPGSVFGVVLQPDGKVVIFGRFFFVVTGPGMRVPRSCIARFNSDGTFDPTFDPGAGISHTAGPNYMSPSHGEQQNVGADAGKIIISGSFDTFDGHSVPGLVRLNSNGSFDPTFNPGTAVGSGFALVGFFEQADGKILAFGRFSSFNGVARNGLVRLNSSGTIDTGFNPGEFQRYGEPAAVVTVAQQPDGKLFVGGEFHSVGGISANNVARLETNGATDPTFSASGTGPSGYQIRTALVRPSDGKIFVGGYFSTFDEEVRNNLAWINSDGSIDSSFAGMDGVTEFRPDVFALATQTDGEIVLTGFFSSFNGAPRNNVLRVNPDGTTDASFDVQTDQPTRAVLIQPDGKVIIAGNFGEVNGVPIRRIARLHPNGTLDRSFDPGAGADDYIYAVTQDSIGNTYVGGKFKTFNGAQRPGVAKLSPSGALDATFNPGGAATPPIIYAMAGPDSTGNIVIGGAFATFSGVNVGHITRLNRITGAIDSTFNTGTGFSNLLYALKLGPDGKYYAGGGFAFYNDVARSHVARLNSDGSLDPAFAPPFLSITVYAVALHNGKVYVGGSSPAIPLVRLTSTGALDSSFATGTGFTVTPADFYHGYPGWISTLAIQSDGKLLVGGIFNHYNGNPSSCLARLTGPGASPIPTATATPTATPVVTPTPAPSPSATPTATPVVTATPAPSPSTTSTATPSETASPTASPTPTPTATPARAMNISTRMLVQTGDQVGIGGFIITGSAPKQVLLRGIGPSLSQFGVPNALADSVIELHGPAGFSTLSNDNWRDSQDQGLAIMATGLQPTDNLEAALLATLDPGAYTAIVKGKNDTSGVGLVEAYDLGPVSSQFGNISTRAFVGGGNNVMIGGFILGGGANSLVQILAVGPSLAANGISGVLADPTLELRDSNGALIASNDNCGSSTIHPLDPAEACIEVSLPPGAFTAILAGKNGSTGVGLVEIYNRQ